MFVLSYFFSSKGIKLKNVDESECSHFLKKKKIFFNIFLLRYMLKEYIYVGKGVHQGCILSSCLFNFYAEYIMRNAGLGEVQAGDGLERT